MLLFPHLLLGSEITISISMPKEIVEIQLKRNAAKKEPWGLRIGGGVDRGKVLVLEKVFLYTYLVVISGAAFSMSLISYSCHHQIL